MYIDVRRGTLQLDEEALSMWTLGRIVAGGVFGVLAHRFIISVWPDLHFAFRYGLVVLALIVMAWLIEEKLIRELTRGEKNDN